jgi:hypothetical protein
MSVTKHITTSEAKELGLHRRYSFSRTSSNHRGSGLYVIQFENGIKIGIGSNLKARLESYKYPWCRPIISMICYKHPNPQAKELSLKHAFKNHMASGTKEFIVNVPLESVINFIETDGFYRPNEVSVTR